MPDDLDVVWKALSDPTRRSILDLLRQGPRTTTEIVETFPQLSRFGVMKHIDVLRDAALITTREEGRQRVNSLNVVPIRQIYERWVGKFEELWSSHLFASKRSPKTKRRTLSLRARINRTSANLTNSTIAGRASGELRPAQPLEEKAS